jgi:rare lipoprotein A
MKTAKTLLLFIFIFQAICSFSFEQEGTASWYGPSFHGKKTANGEIFNTNEYTAAHKTLPFGSIVKVVSLVNGRKVIVRINDRGPYAGNRIIDLSKAAATELDLISQGTMNVKITVLEEGKNVYHKFKQQKYNIQIASFKNENSASEFGGKLKEKNINVSVVRVELDDVYYRIIIQDLNYSELQLYRIRLNREGITDYLVVKIT